MSHTTLPYRWILLNRDCIKARSFKINHSVILYENKKGFRLLVLFVSHKTNVSSLKSFLKNSRFPKERQTALDFHVKRKFEN